MQNSTSSPGCRRESKVRRSLPRKTSTPPIAVVIACATFQKAPSTESHTCSHWKIGPLGSVCPHYTGYRRVRHQSFGGCWLASTVRCKLRISAFFCSRSEEHTSELQSRPHLVCRLLLEKKKKKQTIRMS